MPGLIAIVRLVLIQVVGSMKLIGPKVMVHALDLATGAKLRTAILLVGRAAGTTRGRGGSRRMFQSAVSVLVNSFGAR